MKKIFNSLEEKKIVEAIIAAEHQTSGEIHVHIEKFCKEDVLDRAALVFTKLKMHQTALKNGVLIYLAVKSKKFAIIGDKGIDAVVPADFWNSTKEIMQQKFQQGLFTEGLVEGLKKAGEQLKTHFPHEANDKNELPNELSS